MRSWKDEFFSQMNRSKEAVHCKTNEDKPPDAMIREVVLLAHLKDEVFRAWLARQSGKISTDRSPS